MTNAQKKSPCMRGPKCKIFTEALNSQLRHWIHGQPGNKAINATSCDCTVSRAAVGGTHPTSHVSSSSLYRSYENELMIRGMSSP
jgi:hypothetical protein